jgi:hypothetical protein
VNESEDISKSDPNDMIMSEESDSESEYTKQETDPTSPASDPNPNTLQTVKLDIENQFRFLLAIAYKSLRLFEKSQKEYRKLERIFNLRQGFKLARVTFTNLMLPV